jgi:hypothetical protein
MNGSFVHTFVLTDIATGWTECIALAAREQHLVTEALDRVQKRLPFPLLAFDTDNDGAFINEAVLSYCRTRASSSRDHGPTAKTIRPGWNKRTVLLCAG